MLPASFLLPVTIIKILIFQSLLFVQLSFYQSSILIWRRTNCDASRHKEQEPVPNKIKKAASKMSGFKYCHVDLLKGLRMNFI